MWSRSMLKEQAKKSMNLCYWQAVLAALVLGIVTGGSSRLNLKFSIDSDDISYYMYQLKYNYRALLAGMLMAFTGALLLSIIGILLRIFIFAPIEIGCRRFFILSRVQRTELNELGFGFTHSYGNIVKVQFLRGLYTFLWSLLFVIPGIVKSYEYRMIPYLLAENPELSSEEAFRISREMMDGQKWETFVLDLSFLGWICLSVFTCGLLSIFYVGPYQTFTDAELYITLQNNRFQRYNMPNGYAQTGNPYGANSPYIDGSNQMMR